MNAANLPCGPQVDTEGYEFTPKVLSARIPDYAELGENKSAAIAFQRAFEHRYYAHLRDWRGDDPAGIRETRQVACDSCWWGQVCRGRERQRLLAERAKWKAALEAAQARGKQDAPRQLALV